MPTFSTAALDVLEPDEPFRSARTTAPRRATPLPTMAPGQLWLVETGAAGAPLRAFERDAFNAANVVIYDRALTRFVAAALPLGSYAEPSRAAERVLDEAEFERVLRLTLDGWSVMRLLGGEPTAAQRAGRLRRIAAQLCGAGLAAELPVRLITEAASASAVTETALGGVAGALHHDHYDRRVTAIFAIRPTTGAGPLRAVVDNGLAG
jgi:siroheme synthase